MSLGSGNQKYIVLIAILSLQMNYSCSSAEMAGSNAAAKKASKLDKPESFDGSLKCQDSATILSPGQSISINVTGAASSTSVAVQDNIGTAVLDAGVLLYTAPDSINATRDVTLTLTNNTGTKSTTACRVKLLAGTGGSNPSGSPFTIDDGTTKALLANVYKLSANAISMPNLSTLTPEIGVFMAPNLNVPYRVWSDGFPELKATSTYDFKEWFAIKFYGQIQIDVDGAYDFQFTQLDDGAILSIDNKVLIDANSWCNVANRTLTKSTTLTKGLHYINVDYFQGPRDRLGMVLAWRTPGSSTFVPIPGSVFARP